MMKRCYDVALTFAESINIAAEIIHPFLPIHELAQATHKTITFVVTVVSLIREFNFISSLNTFRDDVRYESLCKWENKI